MSLRATSRLYRSAHRALRIWAHKMSLQTFFGTPAGDCECPCDGTELRWTQSHSSAIRGVAPIQTQIPTEIQSPSCCERQTYTQGRTPTLHLAPEKKGGSVYLPLHAPGTQGPLVCVCVFKRAKWPRLIAYHTFGLNTRC